MFSKNFITACLKSSSNTNNLFEDESFLKSFAESQIPNIYSIANSNSFANTQLDGISYFSVDLQAGIIYDFQLETFKIQIYSNQTKSNYFTEQVNACEELKFQILHNYFDSLPPVNQQKSELQTAFEEKTCEIQSDADYLLLQNKPQEAVERINQYYKETDIIETPNFWQDIDTFIDDNLTELFFNVPELNELQYNAIQQLAKARPELHIFLAFQATETDTDKFLSNIYWKENSPFQKFGCFSTDFFVFDIQYLIPFENRTFSTNVITKKETDNKAKVEEWKKEFAKKYIPIVLSELQNALQPDIEATLQNIETIQNADKTVLYFENWLSDFGFESQYDALKQQQNELVERLKRQHEGILSEKIDALTNDIDIESIEKLDQINKIKTDVNVIENECISEYTEVLEKIVKLKSELSEKELYIKDQLLAKHYIVDTNVFVDCPEILSKIDIKHNVVLSAKVIDELDKLKRKLKGTKKENVEKALKVINQKLGKKKGNIRTARADLRLLPADFNDKSPDNLILCVALMYKDKNPFLLTSDNGLQTKAKICDIPTISLREFIYGKTNLPVNTQTGTMIDMQILIDAYNVAFKKKGEVAFSDFNAALSKNSTGFSHKQFGFQKFKDFCNSLSEVFETKTNDKGAECLILKTTI